FPPELLFAFLRSTTPPLMFSVPFGPILVLLPAVSVARSFTFTVAVPRLPLPMVSSPPWFRVTAEPAPVTVRVADVDDVPEELTNASEPTESFPPLSTDTTAVVGGKLGLPLMARFSELVNVTIALLRMVTCAVPPCVPQIPEALLTNEPSPSTSNVPL